MGRDDSRSEAFAAIEDCYAVYCEGVCDEGSLLTRDVTAKVSSRSSDSRSFLQCSALRLELLFRGNKHKEQATRDNDGSVLSSDGTSLKIRGIIQLHHIPRAR